MPKEDITRARWYTEAEKRIIDGFYDIIFLDHRMPYDDPGYTDMDDYAAFSKILENIGYGLMPMLQEHQPQAIIIGTSSLEKDDIGHYTIPVRRLDKTEMFEELPTIIQSLS